MVCLLPVVTRRVPCDILYSNPNSGVACHGHELAVDDMAAAILQELSGLFPNSEWVLGQAAVAQYNLRNFDMAQSLFEELRLRDPYRTEVLH